MYFKGEGVTKSSIEAVRLWRKAAELGNALAMANLSMMYVQGDAVPKDDKQALIWLKRSALLGNINGIMGLAWYFYSGIVVKQDFREAERLWRLGATKGQPVCMYII